MKRVNVILAGGASRRFGEPKAFAKWKGGMFYEQVKKAFGGGEMRWKKSTVCILQM